MRTNTIVNDSNVVRTRSINMLKYYLLKIEDAVVVNNFSDIAYYNHMIEKEKEILGVK